MVILAYSSAYLWQMVWPDVWPNILIMRFSYDIIMTNYNDQYVFNDWNFPVISKANHRHIMIILNKHQCSLYAQLEVKKIKVQYDDYTLTLDIFTKHQWWFSDRTVLTIALLVLSLIQLHNQIQHFKKRTRIAPRPPGFACWVIEAVWGELAAYSTRGPGCELSERSRGRSWGDWMWGTGRPLEGQKI